MLNKFLNALPKVNDELKVFGYSNNQQKGTAIVTKIELNKEINLDSDLFVNVGKITLKFFTEKYYDQERVFTVKFSKLLQCVDFGSNEKFYTLKSIKVNN